MGARLALVTGLLWMPIAQAADEPWAASRADGLASCERGHDAAAAAHFRRAAELFDARSAGILALMHRFGPRRYPVGIPSDATQAATRAAVAADARRREAAAAAAP